MGRGCGGPPVNPGLNPDLESQGGNGEPPLLACKVPYAARGVCCAAGLGRSLPPSVARHLEDHWCPVGARGRVPVGDPWMGAPPGDC